MEIIVDQFTSERNQRPAIAGAPMSVVLPAHNEGVDFDEVATAWVKYLDGLEREYEIILVDDGSDDDTGPRADSLAKQCPRVRVYHHPAVRGFGAALSTGITAAQYPLLFYTSCDKRYQPADLARLLEAIDKVDLVTGYRIGNNPGWRVWLDRLVRLMVRVIFGMPLEPRDCWLGWHGFWRRWLARWVFGVKVRDCECAFRLFRREIFANIPVQSETSFAQVEILAKANFLGFWMSEVPVTCLPPRGKKSAPESARRIRQEIIRLFRKPEFGNPLLIVSPSMPSIVS